MFIAVIHIWGSHYSLQILYYPPSHNNSKPKLRNGGFGQCMHSTPFCHIMHMLIMCYHGESKSRVQEFSGADTTHHRIDHTVRAQADIDLAEDSYS